MDMITLNDIMTRSVKIVDTEATLREAARMMRDEDVGMLPVYEGAHPVGVITDRDIVIRSVAQGVVPDKGLVRDAMTPRVISCPAGFTVEEVAEIMESEKVRRVLVVDEQRKPVGMVSLEDLASRIGDEALVGEILGEISKKLRV